MTTATTGSRRFAKVGTLVDHLNVPPDRIRLIPQPGTATIKDAIACNRDEGYLCELVDGILVEKPMGWFESRLAIVLGYFLETYLDTDNLGIVIGESGMIWVAPDQMRMPDLAFISWDHFPNRTLPTGSSILDLTPDWTIEVLSPSNTVAEMDRKRREYFDGGAKLVWQVDPVARTVTIYTAFDVFITHGEDASVTGAPVVPGFSLSVRRWFERAAQGA
jgi:Uma2 family endonuclease